MKSDNYDYIIDSDGERIELNDQKIVHVIPYPKNSYGIHLVSTPNVIIIYLAFIDRGT